MDLKILEQALSFQETRKQKDLQAPAIKPPKLTPSGIKKVRDRGISYTHRHRGQWFRPEYDFSEIQIVQDVDSYTARALKKKVDRLLIAGWDFTGMNDESVDYIKRRISFMEIATNKPFSILVNETAMDLIRFGNCMWAKSRDDDKSPGAIRKDIRGVKLDPVAGYHILPFETLEFKTSENGELKKVSQNLRDGKKKEFAVADTIHFYTNKKPGFSVGTPELFPALDDIALLRRLEENVEDLIESNLFPVFHYQVGSDSFPERYGPDGSKETDLVKQTIEYMPPGAVYVSDHRHTITAIGSESKALRMEMYLEYFKKRVFAAIGVSAIDLGEGSANRSTASTLSKGMLMDIEALQTILKTFIDFYVIAELLLEGGYNVLDEKMKVGIQFGVVDKEERMGVENHQAQLFMQNAITQTELRKELRLRPLVDEDRKDTHFELYTLPIANLKTAVGEGANASSTSKANPSNQHGTRTSPKLTHDITITSGDKTLKLSISQNIPQYITDNWKSKVVRRYNELADTGVTLDTIAYNMLPRLNQDE